MTPDRPAPPISAATRHGGTCLPNPPGTTEERGMDAGTRSRRATAAGLAHPGGHDGRHRRLRPGRRHGAPGPPVVEGQPLGPRGRGRPPRRHAAARTGSAPGWTPGKPGASRTSATATSSSGWATPAPLLGLFPFSKISAASPPAGTRTPGSSPSRRAGRSSTTRPPPAPSRQPFPIWVLDTRGSFAVKRPRDRLPSDYAARAVAFCRSVYERQVPFDFNMQAGRRPALLHRADREGLPPGRPAAVRPDPPRAPAPVPPITRRSTGWCTGPRRSARTTRRSSSATTRSASWSSPALTTVYEAPDATWPQAGTPATGTPAVAASPQH